MKSIILIVTVLFLALSFTARACWRSIALEDFVKGKHLIVVGEIQRITTAPKSRRAYDTAFIKIERVLRSPLRATPKVGSAIPLSMPSVNNEMHLSWDIHYNKGQRGIWILHFEDGKYHAGHPMSLQPLSEEQNVAAAMKGRKTE